MVAAKKEKARWEGKDGKFGISRGKLVYTGWINNKVLLYGTRSCIQYPVINHNGKEYIHTHIYAYYIYIYIN